MINKLLVYGFSQEQAETLMKGKKLNVFYGEVKFNKNTGELKTTRKATGETKVEVL